MNQSTKHTIGAVISALLGMALLIGGSLIGIEAWATMEQIEAQGLLGQAVQQEQYEEAVTTLQFSVGAVIVGLFFTLNSLVADIGSTLWELNED